MEHFASVLRPRGQRPGADLTLTSPGEAEKARRFHSGLPGYAPTSAGIPGRPGPQSGRVQDLDQG